MRQKFTSILLLLILLLGFGLSFGAVQAQVQVRYLSIGSGGLSGLYFPVATGMAKRLSDAYLGVRVTARSTGGSVFNVQALGRGELDLAIVQTDVAFAAFAGNGSFKGRPIAGLRSLAILYPEVLHIVARQGAQIRSVADLRGKRVVVGEVGSGTEQNARQVLAAYGLTFGDLGQALQLGPAAGVQQLQDNRADALFYTVGLGASAVTRLAQSTTLDLVPVSGKAARSLLSSYPYYQSVIVPAGTYQGVSAPVAALAVPSVLMTTSRASESDIYALMTALFSDQQVFRAISPVLKNFTLHGAVTGLPAPLHPGAARFFAEKGVPVR
jgi:uncharacterized protein